jgi:hypothetical protein
VGKGFINHFPELISVDRVGDFVAHPNHADEASPGVDRFRGFSSDKRDYWQENAAELESD